MSNLLNQIIEHANQHGVSQKDLAVRTGIAEGSLSRAKRKGSLNSNTLELLAKEAGVELVVTPLKGHPTEMNRRSPVEEVSPLAGERSGQTPFKDKHRLLAWSNPAAPVDVLIRKALVRPDFGVLLDAATELGLERVEEQWVLLQNEASKETTRTAPVTNRMLRHIRRGYDQTTA
jgi:transcriptional regulator with XRE-family HTH domain